MKFSSYDELIENIRELRLQHKHLKDEERDKLVRQILKIDRPTMIEIDGVNDLIQSNE